MKFARCPSFTTVRLLLLMNLFALQIILKRVYLFFFTLFKGRKMVRINTIVEIERGGARNEGGKMC